MEKADAVRTQIRLPADVHAKLLAAAEASGRSLNSEMVQRLEESFPDISARMLTTRTHEVLTLQRQIVRTERELDRLRADPANDRKLTSADALALTKHLEKLQALHRRALDDLAVLNRWGESATPAI